MGRAPIAGQFELSCSHFSSLTVESLYEALKLRSAIFVVEQDCVYQDMDDVDISAHHCLIKSDDEVIAVSRLIPPDDRGAMSIGRVAVTETLRKTGLGRLLMIYSEDQCSNLWPNAARIQLSAQVYIQRFYESLGYSAYGAEYLEDGIPHIGMQKIM